VLATRLTEHLLDEIVSRPARGGVLTPLADRLHADASRMQREQIRQQGQQTHQAVQQLIAILLEAMQRIGGATPLKADLDSAVPRPDPAYG
jgi:hypothetical protein